MSPQDGRVPLRPADSRLFAGAVVAVVAALGAILIATTPHAQSGDPTVDVAARLWLVICTAAVLVVLASSLPRATKGILVAVIGGSALMLGAALVLSANDFAPFGAALDQSTRTALITKYANNWGWVDFAYKGLPVYYPPLSFWVVGRLAAALSIAPWKMLKVDLLATAFLVPVLSWPLWRRVVGRTGGIGAVIGGVLLFQPWYRPHAWLGVALFIPWWVWGVLGVGREPARSRAALAVAAVLGAALFCVYYFPFFLGAIMLVLALALRRPAARRGIALAPANPKEAGLVLGGAALLSTPYWVPIIIAVLRNGAQVAFNRWYSPDYVDLRFRFLTFDVVGLAMLFGLIYLLITARRSTVSMALLGLLAASFVYYVADYAGILANFPLLSFQANDMVDAVLAAGAGLGAAHLWRIARVSEPLRARLGRGGVTAVFSVLAVVVAFSLAQTAIKAIPYVEQQRQSHEPTQALQDFQRATGGHTKNSVVLTDVTELPVYLPLYVFNWWNAHYMNPPARFNDRSAFLKRLSGETDPQAFALALLHNVYDRIDYVALRPSPAGPFQYQFSDDAFPRGVVERTFTYQQALFASAAFHRVDTVSFTVFSVLRHRDPLAGLRSCPAQPRRASCRVLGAVSTRYHGDVDDAVLTLASRWEAARRAG
jgi:galactan 5-O-arabinofuranosyltransferase